MQRFLYCKHYGKRKGGISGTWITLGISRGPDVHKRLATLERNCYPETVIASYNVYTRLLKRPTA